MGIALNVLKRLSSHIKQNDNSINRVIEFGAQQVVGDITIADENISHSHSPRNNNSQLIKHGDYAQKIYQLWGLDYFSIDSSGENNCINVDLNFSLIDKKYDNYFSLVTNFGTSEHIFNQVNCFISTHNVCSVNGLMVHVVPFQQNNEHVFFNYQPNFFLSLALANNYEILDFIILANTNGVRADALIYELDMFKGYSDLPNDCNLDIMCVFKKKEHTLFKVPQQEKYTKASKRYSQSKENYYLNRLLELSTEWAINKEKFLRKINYRKVFLYGAGGISTSILSIKECREKVVAIIDSDPKKQGTSIFGIEVIAATDIKKSIETIFITIDIPKGVIESFLKDKVAINTNYLYFTDE